LELGLRTVLMFHTVPIPYSELHPEIDMRSTSMRLHYQPKADRLPRWLWRVWAWL
jgi:hypothetical protein